MPARTNSTTAKPVTGAISKRFELPALNFKFGSLTEGTDIPPPPPSPKLEAIPTPPKTPKEINAATNGKTNGTNETTTPPQSTNPSGTKRQATSNPASPTLSTRQGSIRRLFSKNALNDAYQDSQTSPDLQRPESRLSTATATKKPKRSSGWFSRLRSSESVSHKRASTVAIPAAAEKKKPNGPPPPMIPELSQLESKEDALSGDLFKDIK